MTSSIDKFEKRWLECISPEAKQLLEHAGLYSLCRVLAMAMYSEGRLDKSLESLEEDNERLRRTVKSSAVRAVETPAALRSDFNAQAASENIDRLRKPPF